jgi:hypothetical protein
MMVFLRIVILLHLLFEQDLFSENRFPLFRIMLQAERDRMTGRGRDASNNTVQTQSKTQCPDASSPDAFKPPRWCKKRAPEQTGASVFARPAPGSYLLRVPL